MNLSLQLKRYVGVGGAVVAALLCTIGTDAAAQGGEVTDGKVTPHPRTSHARPCSPTRNQLPYQQAAIRFTAALYRTAWEKSGDLRLPSWLKR